MDKLFANKKERGSKYEKQLFKEDNANFSSVIFNHVMHSAGKSVCINLPTCR